MRKIFFTIALASASLASFAGGLQHNSNQSAEYVRMISRGGSTSGDAIFYNPAGTALFDEGFTISLNSQTPWQTRDISCDYPPLQMGPTKGTYEGKVFAPVFPGIYAAYKKSDWTFSLGFNPIGGGGASTFDNGLPMLEVPISTVAQMAGASSYTMDMHLEGSSIFYGYQVGAAYKINDMFAVSAGVRLVDARNAYDGYMKNIQFNMGGNMFGYSYFASTSAMTGVVAAQLQPILGTPAAGLTLAQMVGAGQMQQAQADQIKGGLVAAGVTNVDAMNMAQIQGAYSNISSQTGTVAGAIADRELDVKQHGVGFTPILGFNFHYQDLNVGLKYEFRTKLTLTNDTKQDAGMPAYADGLETRSDLPAVLSGGAEYMLFKRLRLSGSFNYYFDKNANYNGREEYVEKNSYEWALGAEYAVLADKLFVSAGFQRTKYNLADGYQNDISQGLSNNTVGFGGAYKFNKMIKLNLGALYTVNSDHTVQQRSLLDEDNGLYTPYYNTTYGRHTFAFAVGVDLTF